MTKYAEFDKAYSKGPDTVDMIPCEPPSCFVGSYAPVTKLVRKDPFT